MKKNEEDFQKSLKLSDEMALKSIESFDKS